jgi:hypothetical protein
MLQWWTTEYRSEIAALRQCGMELGRSGTWAYQDVWVRSEGGGRGGFGAGLRLIPVASYHSLRPPPSSNTAESKVGVGGFAPPTAEKTPEAPPPSLEVPRRLRPSNKTQKRGRPARKTVREGGAVRGQAGKGGGREQLRLRAWQPASK